MSKPIKAIGTGLVFFMILMFQVASGFSAVVISGIIDPILINELGVPAILVGALLGIHFLAEPLRTYVGSLSDRLSFKRLHRVPFILVGGIMLALSYPLIVLVVEQLRDPNYHHRVAGEVLNTTNYPIPIGWLLAAVAVFFFNGTGISIMGTAALSLIVDITSEKVRGLVAAIGWTLLIAGIIFGSVISKIILPDKEGFTFDYSSLYPIFFFVIPGIILVLIAISIAGALIKEPRHDGVLVKGRTHVNFKQALRVISSNVQSRWFFFFLFAFMTFMFMRDILAPAYTGNVFKLSVSERSGLQTTINGPLLVAMILTGLVTLKVAKQKSIYFGLAISISGIAIQAFSAFTFKVDAAAVKVYEIASQQYSNKVITEAEFKAARTTWDSLVNDNKNLFIAGLMLMGIGLGIAVPGLIGMMMDLTDPANAALYMGTWGIGQAFGQGLSNVLAGGARDLAFNNFQDNLGIGYGLVFVFQGLGMVIALWLLTHINVTEFKRLLLISQGVEAEPSPREVLSV
ncbi:MAG: MFS transporter [Chloroflexota bacterium]|nr:MFS transporter [Chloroflexota bacterium]